MSETQATGVIHDLGYRSYDGPRLGRAQIVRALMWHSFRSSYGIGRGIKAKVVPILAKVRVLGGLFIACLKMLVSYSEAEINITVSFAARN